MKKSVITIVLFSALAFTACKSHMNSAAGDSTGTGASGARVPGQVSSDTTHHDSTKNSLSTGVDSSKSGNDTTKMR